MTTRRADTGCTFDPSGEIESILNSLDKKKTDVLMNELLSSEKKIKNIDDFLKNIPLPEKIIAADALAQLISSFPPSCSCCCCDVVSSRNSFSVMENNAFSSLVFTYNQG